MNNSDLKNKRPTTYYKIGNNILVRHGSLLIEKYNFSTKTWEFSDVWTEAIIFDGYYDHKEITEEEAKKMMKRNH